MAALSVHNAEIRTATVEVKTLTISGKQVTQAVFKQLPDRDLIAADGTLIGAPWGRVNYHPGKCADDEAHLHVVWQLGKELFRARVDEHVAYPRWIAAESGTAWADAKVREDASAELTGWKPLKDEFLKTFLGVTVRIALSWDAQQVVDRRKELERALRVVAENGAEYRVAAPAPLSMPPAHGGGLSAARAAAAAAARARTISAGDALAAARDRLEKALTRLPDVPLAEVEARLMAEVRVEADRRRRHREVRDALADLPQLFIAV